MSNQYNPFEEAMKASGDGGNPFMAEAGVFGKTPPNSAAPAATPAVQPAATPSVQPAATPPMQPAAIQSVQPAAGRPGGPAEAQAAAETMLQPRMPAIDLGSQPSAANPFDEPEGPEAAAGQEEPVGHEQTGAAAKEISGGQLAIPGAVDAQPGPEGVANPLAEAMAEQDKATQASFFAKPPVFEYGAVREPVEDPSQTFEDLRIAKADDFPELEEGIRVSWDVRYGKISKSVPNPKKTKIGEYKKTIETSKEFMDALKKDKDKSPDCIIKPRVTAQSKGEKMPVYKGVFTSLEDAEAAGKAISIVPGRDGIVYEIRREAMGTFTTPAGECRELPDIKAGFAPALPPIPRGMLLETIGFFRSLMTDGKNYEAIVNIYWDHARGEFVSVVPRQRVTATKADSELDGEYGPQRYTHYMDVHSHNVMPARFSAQDDADEKATRLYAVVGKLDERVPELSVRISNGGKHLPIDPGTVFESDCDFCPTWNRNGSATLACAAEKLARNIFRAFEGGGLMCA